MSGALALEFEVALPAPDLGRWRDGNTGMPGFWCFEAAAPGPTVGVTALVHGNEIAGAWALLHLLERRVRPLRGTLILGFANLAAFDRFDPVQPTASRFVDEDLNRLWDEATLDGRRQSLELERARELRPLVERLDTLLDLHSMLWPSDPLVLCGPADRGRDLALAMGRPPLIVADTGHASGRRLIDYPRFTDPAGAGTGILVEAGQHWEPATVLAMRDTIDALLATTGLGPPQAAGPAPRLARVTHAIAAQSGDFVFARQFRGGEVVPRRDTLIATDGEAEIRTPHDDCLLVMPSLRPSRGHTAVRLACFADGPGVGGGAAGVPEDAPVPGFGVS